MFMKLHSSKHQGRGKGHVMMAYHSATNNELMALEGDPSTDDTAQWVQIHLILEMFTTSWISTLSSAWPS